MGARSWSLVLFSLCLFFTSGLGTAKILRDEENQEISSTEFSTQFDAVPIVNPTTPGTGNPFPTLNPPSPQAPDTIGQTPTTPITNPTTPTAPYTNPTTPTAPYTNPTTPTAPYTNPTTPTAPYTNPTTPNTNPTTPNTNPTAPTNPTTPTTIPTTPTTTTPASAGGQWCVASQSAADKALKVAIDYACGYGGADCSAIQQGASCYNPNTLRDHASYAFNDYYQKNPAPTSCAFGGTATLINTDPSNGNCHYTSSKTPSMSPPTNVSPPSPTSPMTMTPTTPSMTIPGGSTVYGSEPTGSPNIATSTSYSVPLLFTICGFWAALHVEYYI